MREVVVCQVVWGFIPAIKYIKNKRHGHWYSSNRCNLTTVSGPLLTLHRIYRKIMKEHQRLLCLWKRSRFRINTTTTTLFYGAFASCLVSWFGNLPSRDKNALNQVVRRSGRLICNDDTPYLLNSSTFPVVGDSVRQEQFRSCSNNKSQKFNAKRLIWIFVWIFI